MVKNRIFAAEPLTRAESEVKYVYGAGRSASEFYEPRRKRYIEGFLKKPTDPDYWTSVALLVGVLIVVILVVCCCLTSKAAKFEKDFNRKLKKALDEQQDLRLRRLERYGLRIISNYKFARLNYRIILSTLPFCVACSSLSFNRSFGP